MSGYLTAHTSAKGRAVADDMRRYRAFVSEGDRDSLRKIWLVSRGLV